MRLKYQFENAKLSPRILFSLPAGYTCPFAKECKSRTNKLTGKIIDGKHCRFRCSAATEERMPSVRAARWHNFELLKSLKSVEEIANLIHSSLPSLPLVRIHPSGDFFSEKYFLAWVNVAYNNPFVTFYAYTKAIPFWIKYKSWLPQNFRLTASYGGTHDALIGKYHLKSARVVFSEKEAEDLNLEIDHDDSHAFAGNKPFALLLHGQQPKGLASKIWYKLMKEGHGFSRKKEQPLNTRKIKMVVSLLSNKSTKSNKLVLF